jgi:hypothetical protein
MSTIEPTTVEPSVIESAPAPATPWFKRKRVIIPAAILALFVIGSAAKGSDKPTTPSPAGAATQGAASVPTKPPVVEAPAITYDTPKIGDFEVKLKVTSKQCFGSAGCNLQVKTTLSAVGTVSLDPSVTYELTYELLGGESGPIVDTMELTGDQYSGGGTQFLSTPSSGTKIRARITSIEQA